MTPAIIAFHFGGLLRQEATLLAQALSCGLSFMPDRSRCLSEHRSKASQKLNGSFGGVQEVMKTLKERVDVYTMCLGSKEAQEGCPEAALYQRKLPNEKLNKEASG